MTTNKKLQVVCFGEVLWDIFPEGARAGGAPFNVAYNLNKMKIDVAMISRVGNDELGKKLIHQINDWNIPTQYIQIDQKHDTSTVVAHFDENKDAVYDIIQNVAWDYIENTPETQELVANSKAFVFGSLVTRNQVSKNTLFELMEISQFNVFDVNLRAPYYSTELIAQMLHKTDLVKMNKAELRLVLEFLNKEYVNEDDGVKFIQDKFDIEEVIISKGSKGALYYRGDNYYKFPAVHIQVQDTVGSGDSFLAGFISQRIKENSPIDIMTHATSLGAFITSKEGACPEYVYEDFETFLKNNQLEKSQILIK